MRKVNAVLTLCVIGLFFMALGAALAQDEDDNTILATRGSIPEELMRPRRDEALRYAVDIVIGPLGQGTAPTEAYMFARKIAEDLLKGNAKADSLKAMNEVSLDSYLGVLEAIGPRNFRLGGGRMENDGAVSFLIRFIGRELAITGELYIQQKKTDEDSDSAQSIWIFEDMILEEAQSRKEENDKSEQRFDFTPYHRFY